MNVLFLVIQDRPSDSEETVALLESRKVGHFPLHLPHAQSDQLGEYIPKMIG